MGRMVSFHTIQPPHAWLDVHPDWFITHTVLFENKHNAMLIGNCH